MLVHSFSKRDILLGIGVIVIIVLAGVYFGHWEASDSAYEVGDISADVLKQKTPDSACKVRQTLTEGLKVTISITREDLEKISTWDYKRIPFRVWHINLELTNDTPWLIDLGNDIMLIETHAKSGLISGSACFTDLSGGAFSNIGVVPSLYLAGDGGKFLAWMSSYGIENYELRYRNGEESFFGVTMEFGGHRAVAKKEDAYYHGFGELANKQTRAFEVTLKQEKWIEDTGAGLRLVLPKLKLVNGRETQSYRLVLRLEEDATGEKRWHVAGQELISLEFTELCSLLKSSETDFAARILAGNWLAEEHPKQCIEPLVALAKISQEEQVLATCFQLLMRLKAKGLEVLADELMYAGSASPKTQLLALKYIEATREWAFETPIPEGFRFTKFRRWRGREVWILEGNQVGEIREILLVTYGRAINPSAALGACFRWAAELCAGGPLGREKEEIKVSELIFLTKGKGEEYEAQPFSALREGSSGRSFEVAVGLWSMGRLKDGVPSVPLARFTRKTMARAYDISLVAKLYIILAQDPNDTEFQKYLVVAGATTSARERFQAMAKIVETFSTALGKERRAKVSIPRKSAFSTNIVKAKGKWRLQRKKAKSESDLVF